MKQVYGTGATPLSLTITSYDPYLAGEPAFFQINAYSDARAPIPEILIAVKNSAGQAFPVEPQPIPTSGPAFSRSFGAQFTPNASGAYTITANCGNATAEREVLAR